MGILSRFGDIMKSNINAALDKLEDPSKMIDQTLRDLRSDLATVKKETASIMADEKNAERQLEACKKEAEKYGNAAANAVKAGNDDDARKLISKKQQFAASIPTLEQNLAACRSNSDKMRQMYNKLTNDINELEARKDAIKGKLAIAQTQSKINKAVSTITESNTSLSAFERAEAKANKAFDAAMAEAELNGDLTADADLVNKYGSGSSVDVEDELLALKAAFSTNAPTDADVESELAALKGNSVTVNITTT